LVLCSILRFTYAYLGVETPFNPAVHHKDMEFKVRLVMQVVVMYMPTGSSG